MSAREWKPGDVAVLGRVGGESIVAIWQGNQWAAQNQRYFSDFQVDARPLVVLDPEGDLDPFCKVLVEAMHAAGDRMSAANGVHPMTVRAALRSLITPPKPEEPTNWLAVVEDSAGAQWYRVTNGAPNTGAWARRGQEYVGAVNVYRDIAAVTIVSEGVQ